MDVLPTADVMMSSFNTITNNDNSKQQQINIDQSRVYFFVTNLFIPLGRFLFRRQETKELHFSLDSN